MRSATVHRRCGLGVCTAALVVGVRLLACRANDESAVTPSETANTSGEAVVGSPREPFFLDGGAINRSVMESNVTFRGVRSLKGRGTSSRP